MKTSLHLEAVRAMLNDLYMDGLLRTSNPRAYLESITQDFETPPDWMLAGLNCTKWIDVRPMCIHTFLMDWRPE